MFFTTFLFLPLFANFCHKRKRDHNKLSFIFTKFTKIHGKNLNSFATNFMISKMSWTWKHTLRIISKKQLKLIILILFVVPLALSIERVDGGLNFSYIGNFSHTPFSRTERALAPRTFGQNLNESAVSTTYSIRENVRYSRTSELHSETRNNRTFSSVESALLYNVSKVTGFQLPKGIFKYIIITNESWVEDFLPLVEWKAKKGLPVFVTSVQWISRNYKGETLEIRIKEFLKDAFNTWNPIYVLLAGGTNVIPTWSVRMYPFWFSDVVPWSYTYTEEQKISVPTDWPYVRLDNDAYPEMYISRIPATSKSMMKSIISKIIQYETTPLKGDALRSILSIWGADEFICLARSTYAPPNYKLLKLIRLYNLSESNIVSLINAGVSVVYIISHGSPRGIENFDIDSATKLRNQHALSLFYIDACEILPYQNGDEDSMGLRLLSNPLGGAIAVITTSVPIYYYYNPNYTRLTPIMEILTERDSRIVYQFTNMMHSSFRTLLSGGVPTMNVFCDPETSFWNSEPIPLSVHIPQFVQAGKDILITVTDSNTQERVEGIIVRVFFNDSWAELITDRQGQVSIKTPQSMSSMNLRVYALFQNWPTQINATVKAIPKVIIDKSYVSDNRCDVNSTQTIGFHVKWANNGSDAFGVNIFVNETKYVTNETGWISFKAKYETVGKRKWIVTNISYQDIAVDYNKTIVDPSIIWDMVKITSGGAIYNRMGLGVNVNGTVWFRAVYDYDKTIFALNSTRQRLMINGTSCIWDSKNQRWLLNMNYVATTIGKKNFVVSGILDAVYGLTVIDTTVGKQEIIFDEIAVEIQTESLGAGYVTVKVMLRYKSDSMPITGASVFINGHKSLESENGTYKVSLGSWIPLINIRVEITKEGFKQQEIETRAFAPANIFLWLVVSILVALFLVATKKQLKRTVN